jgi:hypothetical protein
MVGKRKADDEKSDNKFTKRVQTRRDGMTETDLKVDNAKRADAAAISYALRTLRKTEAFKSLTKEAQEQRIEAKKAEVNLKR